MGRLIRIPGHDCYYDVGTSNKSFVMLSRDLKQQGVKNFYFMLELNDPSLINVDPYAKNKDGSPALTRDQIERIILECTRNPWYYLREISRIPDQGGTYVRYEANRGNIAQAWCIVHGLDSWLCLRRQKGKTQSALALQSWMYLFGTSNSSFIFVNKDGDNAKENLIRLRDQIDLLPVYMRAESIVEEDGKRVKSTKNATKLSNAINKNSIIIKSKATSYDKALSLARGLTANVLHFDEPEFTDHIETIVGNSVSTFETAAAHAKANGAAYARIFTCTPGDLDTKAGKEAQNLLNRTLPWSETFYDKTREEIDHIMTAKGDQCNKIIYIEYQWYQIGDTKEFIDNLAAKIGNPITIRRELFLQRIHGSSDSPFDQEDIQYLFEVQRNPIEEMWINDYYEFDIYEKLNPRIPYLVGIDCSTGTGSDNNAITIWNPHTLEPVAEFQSSYIGETKYEELIINLVLDHIPRACVIIERNSVGDGIIDHLLHSPIANNLYFDKNKDLMDTKLRESEETAQSMLKRNTVQKKFYGVYTNGSSRETMFTILSRHVNEYKEKFVTKNITKDIASLVRTRSGKIEAGPGFHDDSIMSYLMCMYVWYHGNNLEYFGISKGAMDESELNKGTKRPDDIDSTLVSPELINEVKKNEDAYLNYENIMRNIARKSQAESLKMKKKLQVTGTEFDNIDQEIIEDFENSTALRMDLFDDLNSGVSRRDDEGSLSDSMDPWDPFSTRNNDNW